MADRMFGESCELLLVFAIQRSLIDVEGAVLLADEEERIAIGFPYRVEIMTVEFGQLFEIAVVI